MTEQFEHIAAEEAIISPDFFEQLCDDRREYV